MNGLAQAVCFFCLSIGSTPDPQLAQRYADIWYTYERPGAGMHLLRLSTTDFIIDSNRRRDDRMFAFANEFADQTCGGRPFTLKLAERASWPTVKPVYARQYIFYCELTGPYPVNKAPVRIDK